MTGADALGGACACCLLELALDPGTGDASRTAYASDGAAHRPVNHPPAIARYRVLRVIGEGGMGTVYEAEQDHPRRTVALKILKPGLSNRKLQRRFELESQALGRLQHPGIAQIYEAGTADTGLGPQPYFVMELIPGRELREYVEARRLTPNERLEMVARIAEAVHHAHQRGIIHRDLKPGNILVDDTGQPKILDFGIARAIDSDVNATSVTDVGQLVGTLSYMSPEQTLADPLEIDTRSDVYALGVILYELLSGRLPYTARTLPDTLRAIRDEEPVRLGLVNRRYRGDVETIAAAAVEKDKARRYGSAAELAADIRRHLADQPIVARPPSAAYQLRKFAVRNRALVAGAAAVLVALILGAVVSMWYASLADRERDRAATAEALATAQRNAALEARDRALAAETQVREERDRATAARDRALALEAQVRLDRDRIAWQNLARESLRLSGTRADDDVAGLLARQAFLLSRRTPDPLRSMLVENALQQASQATPWSHRLPQAGHAVTRVAVFSPDGSMLATNGPDGSIEIWDLRYPDTPWRVLKGRPGLGPVLFAAFSPDGTRLATGGFESRGANGEVFVPAPVKIWDLRNAQASPLLLQGHSRHVQGGAFSPDGTHLVTTDTQTVLLWDVRHPTARPKVLQQASQPPGSPQPPGSAPPPQATSLALSPDGSRLATTDNDGVRIWDMRNPVRPTAVLPGSQGAQRVAFSPDGSLLVLAVGNGVRLLDLRQHGAPRILSQEGASVVAFSPDGARLAAGGGNVVRVWEVGSPAVAPSILRGHQGFVMTASFSPDGSRLVSVGTERTVRIWELGRAGAPLVMPKFEGSGAPQSALWSRSIQTVSFSPDGSRVYSGAPNGAVTMWDRASGGAPVLLLSERVPLPGSPARGTAVAPELRVVDLSADGTRIALAALDATQVWDTRNPDAPPLRLGNHDASPTRSGRAFGAPVLALRLSPDGRTLALSRAGSGAVLLWDFRSLGVRRLSVPSWVSSLAYSPDGSKLAAGYELEVCIWDLRNPDSPPIVIRQPSPSRDISAMAFSSDNRLLAVGMGDVFVWDLLNSQAAPLLLRGIPNWGFSSLAFSRDGELLAAGNMNRTTLVWDLRSPSTPVFLPGQVASVAFSPDGLHLATGDSDGSVRLWPLSMAAADYLCTQVWRNLSMDEWRLHVGDGIPYERTCPGLPPGVGAPATGP
jgi:WD40 repeat protein/tRNA A-37 threonylcarbamoyl transferase component Bud32